MFYHGTSTELALGKTLLPPKETGILAEKGRKKNLDHVFFTMDLEYARIYAWKASKRFGGLPIVYWVYPVGDVGCLSDRPGATVFKAPAARIIPVPVDFRHGNRRFEYPELVEGAVGSKRSPFFLPDGIQEWQETDGMRSSIRYVH